MHHARMHILYQVYIYIYIYIYIRILVYTTRVCIVCRMHACMPTCMYRISRKTVLEAEFLQRKVWSYGYGISIGLGSTLVWGKPYHCAGSLCLLARSLTHTYVYVWMSYLIINSGFSPLQSFWARAQVFLSEEE